MIPNKEAFYDVLTASLALGDSPMGSLAPCDDYTHESVGILLDSIKTIHSMSIKVKFHAMKRSSSLYGGDAITYKITITYKNVTVIAHYTHEYINAYVYYPFTAFSYMLRYTGEKAYSMHLNKHERTLMSFALARKFEEFYKFRHSPQWYKYEKDSILKQLRT